MYVAKHIGEDAEEKHAELLSLAFSGESGLRQNVGLLPGVSACLRASLRGLFVTPRVFTGDHASPPSSWKPKASTQVLQGRARRRGKDLPVGSPSRSQR